MMNLVVMMGKVRRWEGKQRCLMGAKVMAQILRREWGQGCLFERGGKITFLVCP